MRYKNFDIEDFVNDNKFREWVLTPNPEINYFWEKWVLQNPEKETVINQAREIVVALGIKQSPDRERTKKKLWEKIEKSNVAFDQQKRPDKGGKVQPMYQHKGNQNAHSNRKLQRIYISIAASIVLFVLAISFQRFNAGSKVEALANIVIKSNVSGQKSELRLPDGSMVYLNAESNVRYLENFQKGKREIFLEGEAFFEVTKDTSRPFTVITSSLAITALGTSFNIQAYKNASQIKVALVSGKVIVNDTVTNSRLMLNPGEGVIMEKETGRITRDNIDIEKTLFWKNQTVFFENTDFQEAIEYLERWYGVNITVKNAPRKSLTCSGRFENESLENILKSLGFALNFDYRINKKEVNILFK